jgi:hypothetical protein
MGCPHAAVTITALGGQYPAPEAFFMASRPSSIVSSGVVLTALSAPPADAARESAAALLLGPALAKGDFLAK